MFSSSSSSYHSSVGPTNGSGGLIRYDSAPESLVTAAVNSIIGKQQRSKEFLPLGGHSPPLRYFSSESPRESNGKTTVWAGGEQKEHNGLQRAYGSSSLSTPSSSPLVRHSSSPAGFLNRLASAAASTVNGYSVSRGIGGYNLNGGSDSSSEIHRLSSQLSFRKRNSLSQINEESEDGDDDIHAEGRRKGTNAYATASFGMGSGDNSSTIMFSAPHGKGAKSDVGGLNMMETQFQFGLSQTALHMVSMDQIIDIPHDSVPCKARAKRGCATHPRSIAERERRTRISRKLKKLQDLVPKMDKQTSYADMLDLAVQHIKGLQTQVQKLNTELKHCTCGCKQTTKFSQQEK